MYLQAFEYSDAYFEWEPWGDVYRYIPSSHNFINMNFGHKKQFWAFTLDIFHNIFINPWTQALKGKRILIVSPFIKSMKEKINDLSAYHSYEWSQKERFGHKDPKVSEFNSYGFDIDPKPLRPLVKTHNETGQKCLTIGRHINKIPGMSDQEAQNLARELEEFACSNDNWVYHHSWEVGDAVIWDNRCLMHQACMWDLSEGRIMYHSRIEGDPISEAASNYL